MGGVKEVQAGLSSVVQFGDFVVEWSLDALCIVIIKLGQTWQSLHAVRVGLETGVLGKKLTFCDPVHEVAEFKEDKVDVGEVIPAEIRLLSQECDKGSDLLHDTLGDSLAIALGVAGHRGGALEIGDNLSDHLDLGDLSGACPQQLWPVLVRNEFHYRADIG